VGVPQRTGLRAAYSIPSGTPKAPINLKGTHRKGGGGKKPEKKELKSGSDWEKKKNTGKTKDDSVPRVPGRNIILQDQILEGKKAKGPTVGGDSKNKHRRACVPEKAQNRISMGTIPEKKKTPKKRKEGNAD